MPQESGAASWLYDAFAANYDDCFEIPSLRAAYDQLAWELLEPMLPRTPAKILDVGCGTGRWIARCQALRHSVVGIEPSASMREILRRKFAGSELELISSPAESASLPDHCADVALAMGSLQYTDDPDRVIRRMARWLRPGGLLCVHMDSLVALSLELMRLGRVEEAFKRLDEGRGVFTYDDRKATLHLYNAARLAAAFRAAGLVGVETRGLLVSPSALGRDRCEAHAARDFGAFIEMERRLCRTADMTDVGKHIMAWGTVPAE